MAKLKETPAGRSLHNYTNNRNLQSAVLLWKKKKGFGKFRLIVLFILHRLGNGCDLEKKNGATRDPNQMAGITKDFQSECNMRIYSAYSVR